MLINEGTFRLLKTVIKKDGWLELPASGTSMFPFIQQGNVCRFEPCEPSKIKKGDVLLYYSRDCQLIAHRYLGVKQTGSKSLLMFKGDTNLGFDEPVDPGWILGKLVGIKKKQTSFSPEHFLARTWGRIIMTFPVLSYILRRFLNKKLKLQY